MNSLTNRPIWNASNDYKEQASIQVRLLQFGQEAKSEQVKQQLIDDFEQYCQRIQANLENPTPELKQEVIRLLIDHIVVGENEIVIKHIVPTDDDCRLNHSVKPSNILKNRLTFSPML